jgi:MFS family permease
MPSQRATLSDKTIPMQGAQSSAATTVASTVPSGPQVRTITAAAMGTVFEWYEFTLYAAMAGILAAKFFSGLDPSISFIFALLTFGVGFIVRPFGAIVFGRLGDLIGRKRTFMITIVIMGLATFAVGLLPVYETAGLLAPVLLVTMRVLQGLALGGEYGGAVIYVTEHVEKNKRGLSTSFIQMTGTLGFLTALLSIQLVQAFVSQSAFDAWAWRIPFLISIVLLGLSIRVRLQMHESPVFKKMAEQKRLSSSPVRETFGSWQNIKLLCIALIGIGGGMSVVPPLLPNAHVECANAHRKPGYDRCGLLLDTDDLVRWMAL